MRTPLLALALLTLSSGAFAQSLFVTTTSSGTPVTGQSFPRTASASSGIASAALSAYLDGGFTTSRVSSTFGRLQANLSISGSQVTPRVGSPVHFTSATASFTDEFLFTNSALTGTQGSFTFSFLPKGSLTATALAENTYAQFQYAISKDGSVLKSASQNTPRPAGPPNPMQYLNQLQTTTVAFTYGTPFQFSLSTTTTGYAGRFDGGNASAEITSTDWYGFSSVTDSAGAPASYSFSSASGTNWSRPVPEPASIAALGLGALALFRRRKSKRS